MPMTAAPTAQPSGLPPKVEPGCRRSCRRPRPRSPAPRRAGSPRRALGDHHDVGRDPGPFVGEEPAGPAHAALHLVEDQERAGLVAEGAQRLELTSGRARMPPSPWIGSTSTARSARVDRRLSASWSPNGELDEARQERAEALGDLLGARGGDRGRGAAVEGAVEGDDAGALGRPVSYQCRRAILTASSHASVPELVKNTVSAKVCRPAGRPAAPARGCGRGSRVCQSLPPDPSAPRPARGGRGPAR